MFIEYQMLFPKTKTDCHRIQTGNFEDYGVYRSSNTKKRTTELEIVDGYHWEQQVT